MTMQVAMVGSDGIVLASDKQLLREENGCWQPSLVCKIIEKDGLAVGYAKNNLGMSAAERIPNRLAGTGIRAWPALLCSIAEEVFNEDQETTGVGQVLVISPQCLNKIYFLEIGKASRCLEYEDKVVTGDSGNPSRFFAARYYDGALPITQLAFLAAYTIYSGSRLNPGGIQGLDVLFCRNSGFTWATAEELATYRKHSRQLDDLLERAIWPDGYVVDKEKFDALLGKMLTISPLPKDSIPKKRKPKKSRG